MKKTLRFTCLFLIILIIATASTGCSFVRGSRGGQNFTVTADPPDGHPPFTVKLEATLYKKNGKAFGTYVWELPSGTISTGNDNTLSVNVNTTRWEARCFWQDGDNISQSFTVRVGTTNSAPAIFNPLKVGAGHDKFLRPGEESLLHWPVNQELGTCGPSERRGIFDSEGDEVHTLSIKVACLSKNGILDTVFMPPYTVEADGGMRFEVHKQSGQWKNAAIVYPGYTASRYDHRDRPYAFGPLDGSYGWDPLCGASGPYARDGYGLGCGPMGDAVFIYIGVEDEWGARNSAVFIWPLEDASKIEGVTVSQSPIIDDYGGRGSDPADDSGLVWDEYPGFEYDDEVDPWREIWGL